MYLLKPQAIIKTPEYLAKHFKIAERSAIVNNAISEMADKQLISLAARAPYRHCDKSMKNTAFLINEENINKIHEMQQTLGWEFSLPSLVAEILKKHMQDKQKNENDVPDDKS